MDREARQVILFFGAFIVIAFCAILIAMFLFWLSGNTLSQRCANAFPDDGLAQERCVDNLAHGRPI